MAIGDIIECTGQHIDVEVRMCDGISVRRDKFPKLFRAIGDRYGSMDEDTFMLPAMRHPSWELGHFYCIEVDA